MMEKILKMLEAQLNNKNGMKQEQIAEQFGVTSRTIRNWLKKVDQNSQNIVKPRKERTTKLDDFKDVVKALVVENPHRNCELVFETIKVLGYQGQITRLRNFMSIVRKEELGRIALTFETLPGHQAQVDWKECGLFDLGDGKLTKVYAFVMILGYSRRAFIRLTTSMNSASVLACHQKAFEYFGGVPKEILYDNMKTAFVFTGTEWHVNPRLRAFASECGFKPRRCKVYCPWTKGKVERFNGFIGQNLLPRLSRSGESLNDLNEQVMDWVAKTVDTRVLRSFNESRMERFSREALLLGEVPKEVDCSEIYQVVVRNDSTIQYSNVRYTVPPQYITQTLELRVDPLEPKAKLFNQGVLIRELKIVHRSISDRVEHPEDIKSIREIWNIQETKRLARREKEIASQKETLPTTETRNPSIYDQFIEDAA